MKLRNTVIKSLEKTRIFFKYFNQYQSSEFRCRLLKSLKSLFAQPTFWTHIISELGGVSRSLKTRGDKNQIFRTLRVR